MLTFIYPKASKMFIKKLHHPCVLLFLATFFAPFILFAQTITITGKVTDVEGKPLENVSVIEKGTKTGTATNNEGMYSLNVTKPSGNVLVFSSVGFVEKTVTQSGSNVVNVQLEAQNQSLESVVVVGYGTQKKKDVTGAVADIKATRLENENPSSVQDILRGNIAGLNVSSSTSAKGGGDLLVRGKSSINAGTSPLIVLDGVIYQGTISDINPNDIEKIDVLKDASSAAVFGAKSASGVVLITTKRGTTSKPTITLNSNIGFAELAMNQPLYDGPGFVAWRTDVLKSINVNAEPYRFDDPRKLPPDITVAQWKAYDNSQGDSITIWLNRLKMLPVEVQNYKEGKTTNWYDMMFQKGLRQDHTVSIGAKKEDITYYLSLNYTNNEGIIVDDKFSTIRTRLNVEAKAASFLSVGVNMQYADRDESQVPVDWGQMVRASPYGEKYAADGVTLRDSPNDDIGNNTNPFLNSAYTDRLQKWNTLFGSVFAKGDLPFGFSYQVNFTPSFEFYRYFNARSSQDFRIRPRGGTAERTTETIYNWQIDNLLMWNRDFGQHHVDVTLLANAEKFQSWREEMSNEGFDPNDRLGYHNIGSGIKPVISSNDEVSTGTAYMARVNYSFQDRYLLTGSIRRDGYSAFGLQNPTADFPAAAIGWIFTKEKFIGSTFLDYGKLRLSYGINGNRDIGRYLALADLNTGKYQYVKPDGTVILVSQLYVNRLQNPGLKWERTASLNLGLDFTTLKGRLSGSVDVYKKITKDLLINRSLPDVMGFSNVLSNLGEVQNKGLEVALNATAIDHPNFSWRPSFTLSLNRNKIVHLYGPVNVYDDAGKIIGQQEKDDVANKWFIGRDLNQIWDLKILGVWQADEAEQAKKYGVKPGDFKIEDVNGDEKFSDADRQFLGFTTPRYQWSFRNEFAFLKNFDFSFMMYAQWGHYGEYNYSKNNSGFQDRQNSYILPYWTPENPTNKYARLYSSNGSASFNVYRNRSFIRLSTVALAYTLPESLVERVKFKSVKAYVNVQNVGIYQPDWNFWDAEYGNTPPPRYYTLGLNITL